MTFGYLARRPSLATCTITPTFAAHVPFEAPHAPGSSQLRMSEGPPDLKVSHVAGPQVVRLVGQSHDGPLDKRHGSADLEISAASESL